MAAAAHPATSPHRNSCRRFPARCLAPARRPNGWPILPWLLRRLQRLALLLRDAPLQLRPEMHDKPLDGPGGGVAEGADCVARSEEHTSELTSLMRISYAVFCLKK